MALLLIEKQKSDPEIRLLSLSGLTITLQAAEKALDEHKQRAVAVDSYKGMNDKLIAERAAFIDQIMDLQERLRVFTTSCTQKDTPCIYSNPDH